MNVVYTQSVLQNILFGFWFVEETFAKTERLADDPANGKDT